MTKLPIREYPVVYLTASNGTSPAGIYWCICFTFRNGPVTGVPGVPGSTEIADALRRLTPAELSARRAAFGSDTPGMCRGYSEYDATIVPLGCRTPDSIMSTGSSGYGGHNYLRIPNKLQVFESVFLPPNVFSYIPKFLKLSFVADCQTDGRVSNSSSMVNASQTNTRWASRGKARCPDKGWEDVRGLGL